MEEWKEYDITNAPKVSLTELLDFIVDNRGKTVPTSSSGIPLIATNCIKNELLYPAFEKVRYVSDEIYKTWFRSHPIPGDIIFVNKGTPGKTALVPDPVNFCFAQDMMAFRVKNHLVYNKYLLAVLRSRSVQQFIVNSQVGTIIPHFKKEQLKSIFVPLPTMEIQRKIGDFYFSLSEKCEVNRRINDNLEQQAQALFKSWFVDFEPFKDGEFVESELGMIPKGWRVGKLGELCQFKRGKGLLSKDAFPGDVPVVAGGLEPSCYHNRSNTKAPVVTVSGSGANAGFMRMYFKEVWASDCSFIDISCPHLLFVYSFLSINRRLLKHAQTGAVQPHVKPADIHDFDIVIPPSVFIDRFQSTISDVIKLKGNNEDESSRLSSLRDTLLPRLMSGELKINDVSV